MVFAAGNRPDQRSPDVKKEETFPQWIYLVSANRLKKLWGFHAGR